MEQIRLGVIGIGNMGGEHCRNILAGKTPEIALTAAADRREARRDWARNELSVPVFKEGGELIQSGLCDAVLIATPHYAHPPLAIEAFEHGLHVLCEKPAGVYTLQVREMNEAAKKSGKTFAMMFNQRTNCLYRKMKEIISSGELGGVKRVNWIITTWYRSQLYYDSGAWRATWEGEGGGVLLNQCPHQLDLLQWLCGMPVRVRAFCHEGKWHDIEVEDDVTAYMEFSNGATGVFVTSTAEMPGVNRLEILCEKGKLLCENDELRLWRLPVSEREYCFASQDAYATLPARQSVVEVDGDNPQHIGVMNAFAAHILRGEPLVARGEEGICALMLSNAMHLSAWLNQPVDLPFDEHLFLRLLTDRRAASRPKTGKDLTFLTNHTDGGQTVET